MIKLVIFDMDGLLIDSERKMWLPNELKAAQQLGVEPDYDFLYSLIGGSKGMNIIALKQRYGEDFDYEKWYELIYYHNNLMIENNEVPLKEGAIEILDFLKENNIHIALGTSSPRAYVEKVLKNLNVSDRFETITTIENVKHGKPAPDIYQHASSNYDIDTSEMLILEDAHNGLLAAQGCNIRCVLVKDVYQMKEYDYQNAYRIFDNLYQAIDLIKEENQIY